ncbi:MAG TPA: M1 family aminopeptidase [Candidatus Sabulitectum sp.]|nr:M1 family aminopeptidase [Candidatus Sabulitectum sp.]
MMHILLVFLCAWSPRFSPMVLTRPLTPSLEPLYQEFELEPVDVLHYDLSIDIDRAQETIDAVAEITLVPTESGLTEFKLYLKQLTVTEVTGAASYDQVEDSLFITLPGPVSPPDTVELVISYGGTPPEESWGGFHFHPHAVYHMGVGFVTDPSMGKYMFPCHDRPSDKATFDFHITVPDTLYAVANGDSAGVTDNMNGTLTYHWTMAQPMSTYLAALSAADYEVLHDSTDSRIFYYVYSWDVEDALGSYVHVDQMMAAFEAAYGPYPWDCKFSYVQTPIGDMEHLSQVYHLASAVNGNTNYDWLLAHEMGHMWWGDCVTERYWTDVWLSESFATYSEAIWMETCGEEEYLDYIVNNIMKPYLNSGELFPIVDPQTPAELWSNTTYEKGASVLHMLRMIMGDTLFFNAYETYFSAHSYSTATTQDFIDHAEAQYGDLNWFFEQWLYGEGYPIYDMGYAWEQQGAQWLLTITVDQIQTVDNFFQMPVEFLVHGSSTDTLITFMNDQENQLETFLLPFQPVSVEFDPQAKILSTAVLGVDEQSSPPQGGVSTMYLGPNPAVGHSSINWGGTGDMELAYSVYDLSGRVVLEGVLEPSERSLDLSGIPSGTYIVDVTAAGGIRQAARLVVLGE